MPKQLYGPFPRQLSREERSQAGRAKHARYLRKRIEDTHRSIYRLTELQKRQWAEVLGVPR